MLSRTFVRRAPIAAKLAISVPVYEPLNKELATSRFDNSNPVVAQMVSELHARHVMNLGCWRDLSADARAKFAAVSEICNQAAKILDTALERSTEQIQAPKFLIAYGSESGRAEDLARWLAIIQNSNCEGVTPVVMTLNEATKLLQDHDRTDNFVAAAFITSSFGVGDFPMNAKDFTKAIKAGTLTQRLKGLKFQVFGLGNSNSTEHFCGAARTLSAELKKIGATEVAAPVLSCELAEEGHAPAFREFTKSVMTNLFSSQGYDLKKSTSTSTQQQQQDAFFALEEDLKDIYQVSYIFSTKAESLKRDNGRRIDWFLADVEWNFLMTPPGYAPRYRQLIAELNIRKNQDILGRKLGPTDVLKIHPSNSPAAVDRALKRFGLNGFEIIEIMPVSGSASDASFFVGKKIATRTLFADVIDLSRIPSRHTIASLASAAQDASEKAALLKLASDTAPGNEYSTKLTAAGVHTTVLDVLERFPSVKLTLAQALTRLPLIQPRKYSSAKTTDTLTTKFELCYRVAVPGLASAHLEAQVPGASSLWVTIEPGVSTLPPNKVNALFVGLGSGVGLIRNALQSRAVAKAKGEPVGRAFVIAGCRHSESDQLFKEDLEKFKADGLIDDLRLVGSYDVQGKFISPFDQIDAGVVEFLNSNGAEIAYSGVGGSAPRALEAKLIASGINTDKFRAAGRFHESYFTTDHESEHLLRKTQK